MSDNSSYSAVCGGCGRRFFRDGSRKKFCDHDCYAQSLRVGIQDRFWSKVNKNDPSGCWLWTAKARLGEYGSIAGIVNGKRRPVYAHRVSWELTNGPIPDGLSVLHKCDVPLCVNPSHLFLGTTKDNLADARAKGRLLNAHEYVARKREREALNNVEPVRCVAVPVRGELHASHRPTERSLSGLTQSGHSEAVR